MRCGACENLLFVEERSRKYKSDEAREKDNKRLHKGRTSTCLGGPDVKRRCCADIQLMTSDDGRGGRAEVNDNISPSPPSNHLPHRPRTSECAYNKMIFDADTFYEYYRIVSECKAEALYKNSETVKNRTRALFKK